MWVTKRVLSIICGVVAVVLICSAGGLAIAAMSAEVTKGVIVIDAGHGGIDGGVVYGELKESDINLKNALALGEELSSKGYRVVYTRTEDKALDERKKKDMAKRAEIINNAKPDMVLSVHVNQWQGASRRGVQVFYDDTNKNKELGEGMQNVINTYVNGKYAKRTDLSSLGGDYFITKCSQYPTVIIECGFISNAEDRKLLVSEEYRADLIFAISQGVEAYLSAGV